MRRIILGVGLGLLATLAVAQGHTPSASGAGVYFVAPRDGAKIHGPVTVRFGLKGMGVAPAGVKFDNTAHHHLVVDTDLSEVKLDAPSLDPPLHSKLITITVD